MVVCFVVWLSVCPFVCLFVCLFGCQFGCVSLPAFACLFGCVCLSLSLFRSFSPFLCCFVRLPRCRFMFFFFYLRLFDCVCLLASFVSLSVSLFVVVFV